MKRLINKIISLKLNGRKDIVSGYLLKMSNHYSLLAQNPADYIIDGYIIIKNDDILKYKFEKIEKFKTKIIQLKKLNLREKCPINELENVLSYFSKRKILIQIDNKKGDSCYIGSIEKFDSQALILKTVSPFGKYNSRKKILINSINTIQFETDYLSSLSLFIKVVA